MSKPSRHINSFLAPAPDATSASFRSGSLDEIECLIFRHLEIADVTIKGQEKKHARYAASLLCFARVASESLPVPRIASYRDRGNHDFMTIGWRLKCALQPAPSAG